MSDRKRETRRRQYATRSGSKALKLIQPVSKRDQVVASCYVMKNRRDRKSYLASAARHEQLIEALSKLSKAKLRDLMRASLADWKVETLDQWFPDEAD